MKQLVLRLIFIGFTLLTSAAFASDTSDKMSTELSIIGSVVHPLTLTLADLKKMSSEEVRDLPLICQSGANKGHINKLTGIPLKTLLIKAGLLVKHPKDFRKLAFIAYATDNYWVTYSWGEIFNRADGNKVLVYFAKDGKPLDQGEGQFALISSMDTHTGARQVKWLRKIEVRMLQPKTE